MSRAARFGPAAFLAAIAVAALGLAGEPAPAKDDGQDDLDKAVQAKLNVKTLGDLGEVIRLCESAMKKGLDEDNTRFAKKFLASTLVQRGIFTSQAIFDAMPPDSRWPERRRAALDDLEKAVALDPEQAEALVRIAQLNLLPEGDRKRAAKVLDEAIRRATDAPLIKGQALVLRASMEQDPAKKLADLDEAVRAAPGDDAAIRMRALLHEQQGRLEAALTDLNAALKLDPRNPILLEAKAMALARMKKFDEARAVTREWRKLSPKSTFPLVTEARVESLVPDFPAAIKAADEALTLDPTNVGALLTRAMVHQELHDVAKALADLERVLQLEPKNFLARRLRAGVLFSKGKSREAVAEIEEQVKANPDDLEVRLQLAMLYVASEQHEKAVQTFSDVLAKAPKEFEALRGRGDALLGLGKHAEAAADYEIACQVNPKDSGLLNNYAWVLATSPFDKVRNGKRALELAQEACRLTDYKKAHILSTLGSAYAELGNFDEAMKWSQKAIDLGPPDQKEALLKELETYKARKPFRELKTGKEEEKPDSPGKPKPAKPEPAKAAEKPKPS